MSWFPRAKTLHGKEVSVLLIDLQKYERKKVLLVHFQASGMRRPLWAFSQKHENEMM